MREESLYAWVRKNRKNDLGVRNDEVKIGKVLLPVRKTKGKHQ
jgi:hypothetical protein